MAIEIIISSKFFAKNISEFISGLNIRKITNVNKVISGKLQPSIAYKWLS